MMFLGWNYYVPHILLSGYHITSRNPPQEEMTKFKIFTHGNITKIQDIHNNPLSKMQDIQSLRPPKS